MSSSPSFQPDVYEAIERAVHQRLDVLRHRLDENLITTLDDCREAVLSWAPDESLVRDIEFDHRVELVEKYAEVYQCGLGAVTIPKLRERVDHLAAWIIGKISQEKALEVVEGIGELLGDLDLDLKAVHTSRTQGLLPHEGEIDQHPWAVTQHRNIVGDDQHLHLYDYAAYGHHFYVEHWTDDVSLFAAGDARESKDSYEHLGTWSRGGFVLDLYDTNRVDRMGKTFLAYEFRDERFAEGEIVFQGADFRSSPLVSIDSDATVASVLSFFTLRPGDTDAEYFSEYTPRQIEWRDARAEDLAMIAEQYRERYAWRQLHENGKTDQAARSVAEFGEVDDLFEVLDMDIFEAYDTVAEIVTRHPDDAYVRQLLLNLHRIRNDEITGGDAGYFE